MRSLGVNAYRFSIAWPRVVPDGSGAVNAAGLAFYDRLVDGLLEAGIVPFPTLYHWDLPQALQDRGGWAARETAEHFAAFAGHVAEALGDRVGDLTTLNEPRVSAWLGYLQGVHPPGRTEPTAALHASYHLLLGHGLAAQAIRARSSSARVGLVNALTACEPASDSDADAGAAVRYDGHANRWWLDPLYGRGFPADMLAVYGVDLPVRAGDLAAIAAPLDWLGVNYYSPSFVSDDPAGPAPHVRVVRARDGARQTMLGWEVRPDGLEQILVRLATDYGARQLYVTENGSAWPDTVAPDGQVHDLDRVRYLDEHLAACGRAVRRGVPLAGYFAWSLLDNFEWVRGLRPEVRHRLRRFRDAAADHQGQRAPGTRTSSGRFARMAPLGLIALSATAALGGSPPPPSAKFCGPRLSPLRAGQDGGIRLFAQEFAWRSCS